jgi:excinuclease ABC subunit C
LKLLQHLRNEAHKTAITFHRKKRSTGTFKTELTGIEGIGAVTAKKLLSHFKSVKKIREADETALVELLGNARALKVLQWQQIQADTTSSS